MAGELPVSREGGQAESVSICVERSGDWMPVEELQKAALEALQQGGDITLDLTNVDHLDASALQILLALDAEQKQRGHRLQLIRLSAQLRIWFGYAGALDIFSVEAVRF